MLNAKILKAMIQKISDEIKGEWLIFGGSSLYLLGIDSRATLDVDLAAFQISTNEDTLKLMTIAEELQLPVETINQAGAFFLNKIPDWQSRCFLFKKGKLSRIYLPQLDLYLELKAARMSESDLADCLAFLKWHKKTKSNFNPDSIISILRKSILQSNAEQKKRLQKLVEAFSKG